MKSKTKQNRCSGQAMLEYVVAMGVILAITGTLALLLYVFREYGGRVLELVASDYP